MKINIDAIEYTYNELLNFNLKYHEFPKLDDIITIKEDPIGYTGLRAAVKELYCAAMALRSALYWVCATQSDVTRNNQAYRAWHNYVSDLRGDNMAE